MELLWRILDLLVVTVGFYGSESSPKMVSTRWGRGVGRIRKTPRQRIKKCTFPAEGMDLWEVSVGHFRTRLEVPGPLKVGGASPPDLPGSV